MTSLDAMVDYEALVIRSKTRHLSPRRRGSTSSTRLMGWRMANSPLGYVNHDDPEDCLSEAAGVLLSPTVQQEDILATGRRVGLAGLDENGRTEEPVQPRLGHQRAAGSKTGSSFHHAHHAGGAGLFQTAFPETAPSSPPTAWTSPAACRAGTDG